ALAPLAALDHDRPQLLAGGGEMVLARAPLDHSRVGERAQPLREHAARHERHAALQVAEPMAAAEELADHQQGPPLAENLERLRHRTELVVSAHAVETTAAPRASVRNSYPQVRNPNWFRDRRARRLIS